MYDMRSMIQRASGSKSADKRKEEPLSGFQTRFVMET